MMRNAYNSQTLELSYKNCEKLVDFLAEYRGAQNKKGGKYSVPLYTIQHLFNETWTNIPTSSGHIKLQHSVTKIVVNYKNHDNDPVDPGAVVTIANQLQQHINTLFEQYLGCSTRTKKTVTPDFVAIAQRLNAKPAA